jgi:hypothetical protein
MKEESLVDVVRKFLAESSAQKFMVIDGGKEVEFASKGEMASYNPTSREVLYVHTDTAGDVRYYSDKALKKLHRTDGPAVISGGRYGYKQWWKDGVRHRTDGPAVEYAYGVEKYFLNGTEYTEQQYRKLVK